MALLLIERGGCELPLSLPVRPFRLKAVVSTIRELGVHSYCGNIPTENIQRIWNLVSHTSRSPQSPVTLLIIHAGLPNSRLRDSMSCAASAWDVWNLFLSCVTRIQVSPSLLCVLYLS